MRSWLIEPYYTGSHAAWANGYMRHSRHEVRLFQLPGMFWKWRMHGGAVTLARVVGGVEEKPDLLFVTDMLSLPAFLGLTRDRLAGVPVALYFHENQLTYPLQPGEKRDLTYGFINYASALAADLILFNSRYHMGNFFDELRRLLKHFPDHNELWTIQAIREKSQVLPVGIDLCRLDAWAPKQPAASDDPPLILWNQRWEYDKNPAEFFRALYALLERGLDFRVALCGENFRLVPAEFEEAKTQLGERIVHYGYASDGDYAKLLWQADIVVSTALHDFFGVALVEAMYCGCFPILPRRLTYPDLLPPEVHDRCLYADFAGLVERLAWALTHIAEARISSLRDVAARYDWSVLAPTYDEVLADVAGPRRLSR
jgi:glycosyltransferase involved in cell wall biosynthesis